MPGSDVVIAWVDDNGQVTFNVSSYTANILLQLNLRIDMQLGVFNLLLMTAKTGHSLVGKRKMERWKDNY